MCRCLHSGPYTFTASQKTAYVDMLGSGKSIYFIVACGDMKKKKLIPYICLISGIICHIRTEKTLVGV